MADNTQCVKALRVGQLDAAELDHEVLNLTRTQLSQVFKYLQTGIFTKYNPEIQAFLKLVLWKFTVLGTGATVGQQILNIRYGNPRGHKWIGRREKILHALLLIGCPWMIDRSGEITSIFGLTKWKDVINKWLSRIETTVKIATLANFLIFINHGGYLSVVERILGIQSMYPERQGIRQVSFEYMTRELLWHGFSEFLFFTLPLINLQKIENTVRRWYGPDANCTPRSRSQHDLTSCAVCSDWPINPQEIGCQHVFCYYCIQSQYGADPGFTCPLCDCAVGS